MKFDISKFIKPWAMEIEPYIPGKTMKGYIKLASNENNYGPSQRVIEALQKGIEEVNIYPYRDEELRGKVADYCKVDRENVILGNGSDELMDLIFKIFKGPILGVNPSFSGYKIFTLALGEKYLEINLKEDFGFPLDEFIEKSKEANILILCSPNNPTGGVISEEDIKAVLDQGKITVVDEAYYEFYGKSFVPLISEYPNLIVLRTFAKAFALAGLRIGYAISNSGIINALYKVKPPFNVNSLALVSAIAALDSKDYMKTTVERIKIDREILFRELSKKFKAFRSEANFILMDVSPIKATEFFENLLKKGIIVRAFGKFSGFIGEYVRISVGTSEENRKLIEALEDI
ncbi:MAG: histidinol-phosphate transaminase [Candidatus Altiarchaeales archaeon]|nr:MAG: histidinol-phosphate transaminase [Candidatus Altiarchaeales archaeon]